MSPTLATPPGAAARDTERHAVTAHPSRALRAADCLDHATLRRTIPAGDPPPGRYLEVGQGDAARLVPLGRSVTHLGRGLLADVRLEHRSVSRHHAMIVERGGACWLLDDRSLNGTFVAGAPVLERRLSDGDEIRLGTVPMRYREIAGASRLDRATLAAAARTATGGGRVTELAPEGRGDVWRARVVDAAGAVFSVRMDLRLRSLAISRA